MGKASRDKGHNFERVIARLLQVVFPDAKRGFQTRGGGKEECDVEGTPFHIECKRVKKSISIWATMAQAVEDSNGRPPLVIIKRDNEVPYVMMKLSDWLALYSQLQGFAHLSEGAELMVKNLYKPRGYDA